MATLTVKVPQRDSVALAAWLLVRWQSLSCGWCVGAKGCDGRHGDNFGPRSWRPNWDDKPVALAGLYGNLAGLAVDSGNNVYVADAGNRRLFKINSAGQAEVVLRTDPPFFPNGVVAALTGVSMCLRSVSLFQVQPVVHACGAFLRTARTRYSRPIGVEGEKPNPAPPISRKLSESAHHISSIDSAAKGNLCGGADRGGDFWGVRYDLAAPEATRTMKTVFKVLSWIILVGVICFIGIQFVRPAKTNPSQNRGRPLSRINK